ncbi:hypothetical protein ACH40F_56270 [Streptomyces sp. NPDC020794]|uniref:hypothetical protein n=1 Tax=unclassified Streptomyces TaxID=2593676 RepID=UPI0036E61FB4
MLTTGTTRTADTARTTHTIGTARTTRTIGTAHTISITARPAGCTTETTETTRPTSVARITTSVLTSASPRKGRS